MVSLLKDILVDHGIVISIYSEQHYQIQKKEALQVAVTRTLSHGGTHCQSYSKQQQTTT